MGPGLGQQIVCRGHQWPGLSNSFGVVRIPGQSVLDLDRDREAAMQDARCVLCCVSMTDLRKLAS